MHNRFHPESPVLTSLREQSRVNIAGIFPCYFPRKPFSSSRSGPYLFFRPQGVIYSECGRCSI